MNVYYEEEGTFKVGSVLADNTTSLQVEAPHGKRSKVKSSAVLLRFDTPPLASFLAEAQRLADAMDIDFLWQCCGESEFDYAAIAQEYFGHPPAPVEAAAILSKLHGAPMYFYKKGRGRYRAAPAPALAAALASVARKAREAEQKAQYVAELRAFRLPAAFGPMLDALLFRPEKSGLEWKALEEAAALEKLAPARLIERCGGIPSSHDYHFRRFAFEHFPRGTGFGAIPDITVPGDLPLADATAYSIDDAETTEIDDAFSVAALPGGRFRVGIHIAAPALGAAPGSPVDLAARERLSTVYYPGGKLTMLPAQAIDAYTLGAGRDAPALSLYLDLDADLLVNGTSTRVERVRIAGNLRHDALDPVFNARTLANGAVDHAQRDELVTLWKLATRLERLRRGDLPEVEQRAEYVFRVDGERVTILPRARGTPVDKVVSELMIYANSEWGRLLAEAGVAAIYRVQGAGKVRMSTVPGGHEGLGVAQYVWSSSPLRRYVDLVNQRQIIALARGEAPPYPARDESLLSAMRDFEAAYEVYAEFQRNMERYWCLRWLLQEKVETAAATVIRDNLARFDALPMVVRVPSLPSLPPATPVMLSVSDIDLIECSVRCEFARRTEEAAHGAAAR